MKEGDVGKIVLFRRPVADSARFVERADQGFVDGSYVVCGDCVPRIRAQMTGVVDLLILECSN